MAVELFANLPSTTVTSGGTSAPAAGTPETWTVASSSSFPAASNSATAPTQFHIADVAANSEIILVSNVSGTTWTVTRGSEGTTPVAHTAGFAIFQVVSAGGYQQLSRTDWLNPVTMFGADPTGTADSTTAINNALTAAPLGGTVYLPAGTYKTTAPLVIPPQVTLLGPGSWHLDTSTCEILPAASFSGAAIILMYDQSTGGYSVASSSQAIKQLIINGSALGGSVDGIQSQGYVHGVIIQDVQIYKAPAHGIACVTNGSGVAYSWRGTRVSANTCGTHGFSLSITDCTWYDLEAIGCTQNGFNLSGSPANSHFTDCRSEYNSNGFNLSGAWGTGTGSGGVVFTGCSTDGNVQDGVHLAATGSVPVTFEGLMCRRDGANGTSGGGGYGGVRTVGHTLPTQVNGLSVFPGIAQVGGANSPEYGVAFTSSSANITVGDGAVIYAATTPWYDDGSNSSIGRGANVTERTGTTSSYTTAYNALQVTDTGSTFAGSSYTTNLLLPDGTFLPQDASLLAWNYDPATIGSGTAPASGTVQAIWVPVRVARSITNVILFQVAAGSGLVVSECYAGIYSSAGVQIGITADQSTPWGTGADVFKTMALASGPFTVSPPGVWVLALANESAGGTPQWGRWQNFTATSANAGLSASKARWATGGTTQTSLPAGPITPSSYFTLAQVQYWAGLS
jgi:Pectate lyase superfamily protein